MTGRQGRGRLRLGALAVLCLLVAACTPSWLDLSRLSSDAMDGRNNQTPGGQAARDYLVEQLKPHAAVYLQPFKQGTNVLGVIPGTDLREQYVVVGAHYDHLGHNCRSTVPDDHICNGATDNAAGDAVVLSIARWFAQAGHQPRRTIIVAFWDAEEDGYYGSRYFVAHPPVPLASIATYVNADIQGSNLLPSLRTTTFAVGGETGGPALAGAIDRAAAPHADALHEEQLSLVFGEGRSDHISFIEGKVPAVDLSDSTGPCYHTAQDELRVVDVAKLDRQIDIAQRLVTELADASAPPSFDTHAALTTYADALALQRMAQRSVADLGRFNPAQQAKLQKLNADVDSIVARGPGNFSTDDQTTMLADTKAAISVLQSAPCDGYLADPPPS